MAVHAPCRSPHAHALRHVHHVATGAWTYMAGGPVAQRLMTAKRQSKCCERAGPLHGQGATRGGRSAVQQRPAKVAQAPRRLLKDSGGDHAPQHSIRSVFHSPVCILRPRRGPACTPAALDRTTAWSGTAAASGCAGRRPRPRCSQTAQLGAASARPASAAVKPAFISTPGSETCRRRAAGVWMIA